MRGLSRLDVEIERVERALSRYESEFERRFPIESGDCCHGCVWAGCWEFDRLDRKIGQVLVWLEILKEKRKAREAAHPRTE